MSNLVNYVGRKIAHMGVYDNTRIYENTLSAFTRAIKNNFIIEFDVRIMGDGTLICFKDDNTNRLLHVDEKLSKISYDELCYLSKFQIPTLESALETIHGSVPIIIHLKDQTKKYLLENKVAEILDKYKGIYVIASYNIKTLKWFYKNRKDTTIGYIVDKKNYGHDYFFKKYHFICIDAFLLDDKKIRKLREDRIVFGYGIENKKEYKNKKDVYDNLVLDNILEIDTK